MPHSTVHPLDHHLHPHHHLINGQGQPPPSPPDSQRSAITRKISQLNEVVWIQIGRLSELMGDLDNALVSYEHALRHNQWSVPALYSIAGVLRTKEQFQKAMDYLHVVIKLENDNGEAWGQLGHCLLMLDNLSEAYVAYQQSLYHLQDPKDPKLWYGIGILYDRYGSLQHAENAFAQVMEMAPDFEKANEIYFRLGIIYKQQSKFSKSLECFRYIVSNPPRPLTEEDIWFQIGHVHEQQKDFDAAKMAYDRVLERDPAHAKVLQQLGAMYHVQSKSYFIQEQAIEYLEKSVKADANDPQSWFLLGRCYMIQSNIARAYEAYQQAVYRDGDNPAFWCSIGTLYHRTGQFRDALDAYSRSLDLNPNSPDVWCGLGELYKSCNNQTNDALNAFMRAAQIEPDNPHIKLQLESLQNSHPVSHFVKGSTVPLSPEVYHPVASAGPPPPGWGPPPSQVAFGPSRMASLTHAPPYNDTKHCCPPREFDYGDHEMKDIDVR